MRRVPIIWLSTLLFAAVLCQAAAPARPVRPPGKQGPKPRNIYGGKESRSKEAAAKVARGSKGASVSTIDLVHLLFAERVVSVSKESLWQEHVRFEAERRGLIDLSLPVAANTPGAPSRNQDLHSFKLAAIAEVSSNVELKIRSGLTKAELTLLERQDSPTESLRRIDRDRLVARLAVEVGNELSQGFYSTFPELLRRAEATAPQWGMFRADLLEIQKRQVDAARLKDEAKRRESPGKVYVRTSPWYRRSTGEIWLRWLGTLEQLQGDLGTRLLKLPTEVRYLAFAGLSKNKALAAKTIADYEKAVHHLCGNQYPEVANTLAAKLGGRLLAVSEERGAGHRVIQVKAGSGQSRKVLVPRWEFFGLERRAVAKRFSEAAGRPTPDEVVLFVGGDQDYVTRELLPGHFTARTFEASLQHADRHLANVRSIESRSIDPSKVAFFDFLPQTGAEVAALPAAGSTERWLGVAARFREAAKPFRAAGVSRESFLSALRSGNQDAIVVVGHGTPDAILLPNGDKITRQDILDLPPFQGDRQPLIVLVACRTGAVANGSQAVAQALLSRGYASAVLAPTRWIEPRQELATFVETLASGKPLRELLSRRPEALELWVNLTARLPSWIAAASGAMSDVFPTPV